MPSIVNDRLVLWHLPKTAGTWASFALEAAGAKVEYRHPKHATWRLMPGLLCKPFQALIVRRPWDWYWSVWRYLRRNDATDEFYREFEGLDAELLADFPKFCIRYAGFYRGLIEEYRPTKGCVILRTEYIDEDLAMLVKVAGLRGIDELKLRTHPPFNVGPERFERPNVEGLEHLVNRSNNLFE